MAERYTSNQLHDRRHMLSYEFRPSADLAKGLRRVTPEASQTAPVYADALRFISVDEESYRSESFQASLARAQSMFRAVESALYLSPDVSRENGAYFLSPFYAPAFIEATRPLLQLASKESDRHDGLGYIAFTAALQEAHVDEDALNELRTALRNEQVRRRYSLHPLRIRVDSDIPS